MTKKPQPIYLILICLLFLCSCATIYTPALYHQDIAYLPKPASFDSAKTKVYASAGFNFHPDTHQGDLVYSGQADLSVGHVFKNFNLAYGAFAEFGDYANGNSYTDSPNYFSDRTFGAVGGRFSANLYHKYDRADFRFIGVEAAYSHEFGDFNTFKQNLKYGDDYYVDPRTNLLSVGLTTEVIFSSARNQQLHHGLRGFLGVTLGHNLLNDTFYSDENANDRAFREIFPKFSYFINYKHFFAVADAGAGIMLRAGYSF